MNSLPKEILFLFEASMVSLYKKLRVKIKGMYSFPVKTADSERRFAIKVSRPIQTYALLFKYPTM